MYPALTNCVSFCVLLDLDVQQIKAKAFSILWNPYEKLLLQAVLLLRAIMGQASAAAVSR